MYQQKDLFHCLLSQTPCKQTRIHTSFHLQHAFDLCKIELEIEVAGMFSTHHNHEPFEAHPPIPQGNEVTPHKL